MIRIYMIQNCPYCKQLKEMFIKEGLQFQEIDVNKPENEAEWKKLHEVTKSDDVPIVKVGPQLLVPNTSFQSINEAFELTKKFLI
jgi:glutaredoxin